MAIDIDRSSEFGARVLRRLEEDEIIWLTTGGKDGAPQPNPVWFIWTGEQFLIFSQPDNKIGNIERSTKVALSFNSDQYGSDVVVFNGEAALGQATDMPDDVKAEYIAKYERGMKSLGMDPETFQGTYSRLITVTPSKLRGF